MLHFDPVAHRYTWNGKPVPGVTQVLAPMSSFEHVPPEVLADKSALGTAVHACCEFLDQDDLDESSMREEWVPYVEAYKKFLFECKPKWSHIEDKVFHNKLHYAGTLDRAGELFDYPAIVDLKTVATLHAVVGIQLAAYEAAVDLKTRKKVRRYALQLKPDGTYRLEEYKEAGDFGVFTSLLAVHNWIKKHNAVAQIYQQ